LCRLATLNLCVAILFQGSSAVAETQPEALRRLEALTTLRCNAENAEVTRIDNISAIAGELAKSPTEVGCWIALSQSASSDGRRLLADHLIRSANRANGQLPELAFAHARVLPRTRALSMLDLAAVSMNLDAECDLLKDLLKYGILIPTEWDAVVFISWADALLDDDRIERAEFVVREGLKRFPHNPTLLMRKAMVLALEDKFDESQQAATKSAAEPPSATGKYKGLADCLAMKGQFDSAIQHLEALQHPAGMDRRLLATLYAKREEFTQANELLVSGEGLANRLIRLRVLVLSGQNGLAKSVGNSIVSGLGRGGSRPGPWLEECNEPVSLWPEYASATNWLLNTFPNGEQSILDEIGSPQRVGRLRPVVREVEPINKVILRLEQAPRQGAISERQLITTQLAVAYADAGRFAEALREITPFAAIETLPSNLNQWSLNTETVNWSRWKRNLDTEILLSEHPEYVVLLAAKLMTYPDPTSQPDAAEASDDAIAAFGPGVLSLAFEGKKLPYGVIKKLAREQDVPSLLKRFVPLVLASRSRSEPNADEEAIHQCLLAATGAKCDRPRSERMAFWIQWWDDNAKRIVLSQ
jgi:tetratricopeptide (TPR) repeat protein